MAPGGVPAARKWQALLLAIAGILTAFPQLDAQETGYRPPAMAEPLFDVASLKVPKDYLDEVVAALTGLATHPECSDLLRSRALGIALRIDKIYRPAFSANMLLKQGKTPEHDGRFDTLAAAAVELAARSQALRGAEGAGDDDKRLAGYLLDLAAAAAPDNVDYAYELTVMKEAGVAIDWQPVTGAAGSTGMAASSTTTTRPGGGSPPAPSGGAAGAGAGAPLERRGESLPRLQALIKGLLVQPLEANQYAGKASQMNATASRVSSRKEMVVGFNQDVGPMMESALGEVIKYLRVRHDGLPKNHRVEIAFEEQFVPKDGPSAAVACALLLESLILDFDLDPDFAVTGDLNADGTVQPVGGITGKLRGAAKRDCKFVGIPVANARVISDMLIMEGPQSLIRIQIFSLETFDEALALARVPEHRSDETNRSLELFEEVLTVLNRPNGMSFLRNSHVQGRLRECLKLMPNHLSARYLLLASMGRAPDQLTLEGSLTYIDRAAEPLLRSLRQGDFDKRSAFEQDEFAEAASALRRIEGSLDPRVKGFSGAIVDYSELLREFANNRPRSQGGLRELIARITEAETLIGREYDDLMSRVDVREELME